MIENLFCKIFVHAASDREALIRHVAEHLNGMRDGSCIECVWGPVDVLKNDDADCSKVTQPDGFLHYPYLVETEPKAGFDRNRYITGISQLLENLWASNFNAVAACGFERELPRKGGYNLKKMLG